MRGIAKITSTILILSALPWIYSLPVNASSVAGIEIEFGNFKLDVYYSVALDYDKGADKFIRDPQLTLFALAALLQANSETFVAIDHQVEVELYKRSDIPGNFLSVIEDPQAKRNIIRDGPVEGDISMEIVRIICDRYAYACKQPSLRKIVLYRCQKERCPGKIRFGSFPSVHGVNEDFGLLPPPLTTDRIKTTKDNIRKYFEILE